MTFTRKSRFLPLLLASIGLLAAAPGCQKQSVAEHDEIPLLEKRLALLQEDNDRLRALIEKQEKAAARPDEDAQRKAIEEATANIRGLDFKEPVVYETLTRQGIKKVLEQKLGEQYSDLDFQHYSEALAALGLLEPGYPLKEKYVDLLGEQIAAFYDQHQHKLFMFEDATLADMQNKIVLSHELTHALQDQHFGLKLLPLEVKDNDDLALATSALIEGDATVVMQDYMMHNFTLKALRENLSSVMTQNTDQLKKAPRFMREMLMFPYVRGLEFCTALQQRGGYEALSDAYKNPPASSTQILHPEKYLSGEMPIRVEWTDTSAMQQKPIDDNVLGEFGIRILFTDWVNEATAKEAATGWRGDRYLVYDGGKALVWKTLWADEAHAQKFYDTLLLYVSKRFPHSTTTPSGPMHAIFTSPECTGEISMAKADNGIIFMWGATKEWNQALTEKFKEAQ